MYNLHILTLHVSPHLQGLRLLLVNDEAACPEAPLTLLKSAAALLSPQVSHLPSTQREHPILPKATSAGGGAVAAARGAGGGGQGSMAARVVASTLSMANSGGASMQLYVSLNGTPRLVLQESSGQYSFHGKFRWAVPTGHPCNFMWVLMACHVLSFVLWNLHKRHKRF